MPNATINTIMNRRSIRKYKNEQISDSELQIILDAAIYAPNAVNQQKWHFTVIQNKDVLQQMVDIIKENILNKGTGIVLERASQPDYHTFHRAPTVILISADEQAFYTSLDCGLAAGNIALAAEALNIGSCVIASSALLFASDKGKELFKQLGIPEGYKHICTVALGYKDEQPEAPARNKDVINYIR